MKTLTMGRRLTRHSRVCAEWVRALPCPLSLFLLQRGPATQPSPAMSSSYSWFPPKKYQWDHIPNIMAPNPPESYVERMERTQTMSKIPDFASLAPPALPDPPAPSTSTSSASSSSLAAAFSEPAPPPRRPPRTEPPAWYSPYPYPRSWTLGRRVTQEELWAWHHREDDWPRVDGGGAWLIDIKHAVWSVYTNGVRARQQAARREWEEARLLANPPMAPKRKGSGVSHGRDVRFQTFDWDEGVPVRALIAGRRALQHLLRDANTEPFKGLRYDTIRVRMKVSGFRVSRVCVGAWVWECGDGRAVVFCGN